MYERARRSLTIPTDLVGRQFCYDCGAPLRWDPAAKQLRCSRDLSHAQNPPHPDFRPAREP